jgi:hypothetical protein
MPLRWLKLKNLNQKLVTGRKLKVSEKKVCLSFWKRLNVATVAIFIIQNVATHMVDPNWVLHFSI